MQVVTTRAELAQARRQQSGSVGLVPTMGFLHEGHLSLVRRARQENDAVAVSIFVNPKQFGEAQDFETYPRDTEHDLRLLEAEGVDLVWTPDVTDIYPAGFSTSVALTGVTEVLEGAHRPGHFAGVATIVSILFNATRADRAYFGQKDAQQLIVVRKMVADLAMPVEIVAVPTFREDDGLAMSSRNVRLNPRQREHATVLRRALGEAESSWRDGVLDADLIRGRMSQLLAGEELATVDYVSVADPTTLDELERIDPARGALASMAVRFGSTRLIDNVVLSARNAATPTDR